MGENGVLGAHVLRYNTGYLANLLDHLAERGEEFLLQCNREKNKWIKGVYQS